MTKTVNYLIQLMAVILITGGGIAITCFMFHGKHCIYGWLIVILGVVCLAAGADQSVKTAEKK